jgi:hypothetical protein
MPLGEIKQLEELLFKRYGESLASDKPTHRTILEILNKGKINNEDEYRVVQEYLRDITDGDPYFDKISEMEELMEEFNNRDVI